MRGRTRILVALLLAAGVVTAAGAQEFFGRRGGRFALRVPRNPPYDGAFQFCRIMFRQNPQGDGGGWSVDYPRADINFPYRLSELTATSVSKDGQWHADHS